MKPEFEVALESPESIAEALGWTLEQVEAYGEFNDEFEALVSRFIQRLPDDTVVFVGEFRQEMDRHMLNGLLADSISKLAESRGEGDPLVQMFKAEPSALLELIDEG